MRFRDLSNQQFGRLTALEPVRRKFKPIAWLCRCACGNTVTVAERNLHSGNTKSCGCLQREASRLNFGIMKHGMSHSPEYYAWQGMIQRCHNPKNPNYNNYGARNILVCACWKDCFAAFLKDMGSRPSPKHSLERIDNEKGYSPDNCRWARRKDQARNMRRSRFVTLRGKTMTVAEWSEVTGITYAAIITRLKLGWPVADALSKPVHQ